MRSLLTPFSWLYSGAMKLRTRLYDAGLLSQYRCEVPVISAGNLSVGGTGKTPLVEYIAANLLQRNLKVGIVSRGYKRTSSGQVIVSKGNGPEVSVAEAGDEPYMLAALHPELRIVVDKSRVNAAKTAKNQLASDVILMDDGFQHLALARDVNIVIVPVDDVVSHERVLPAGRLRESWKSLERATHIVLTGEGESGNEEAAEQALRSLTNAKIYRGRKDTGSVLGNPVKVEQIPLAEMEKPPAVMALAGIGHPEQFRKSLEKLPVNISEFRAYPDHHNYSADEQKKVLSDFRKSDADYLVMTAKDFVKWDRKLVQKNPIYFLPVKFELPTELLESIFDCIELELKY